TDLTLDDMIPSIRQEAGSGLTFRSCSWFSTYRIHHRRAQHFRDRRCFLLGDAAHIHSPVGAQGMNTGLQDAYNLGWKLALVVSQGAGPALLDSYEAERIPVAQRLLSTTDRAFAMVVSNSRAAGLFRTRIVPRILALAMRVERIRRLAFLTISQIGIHYRNSSLSENVPGLPDAAPRAGDRFPWLRLKLSPDGAPEDLYGKLDDTRFTLIVIGQPAPGGGVPGLGDLLRVLQVPSDPANERELERVHIPRIAFYLLRPDGHVGLAGVRLETEALALYISDYLHLGIPHH
ncbi:MAG: FAD-dependent monooxygenase, partial [Gemmatimonadales bacterium]|nr:FAD-dependent monooxygenase [Gemmatimonadales bacterium]